MTATESCINIAKCIQSNFESSKWRLEATQQTTAQAQVQPRDDTIVSFRRISAGGVGRCRFKPSALRHAFSAPCETRKNATSIPLIPPSMHRDCGPKSGRKAVWAVSFNVSAGVYACCPEMRASGDSNRIESFIMPGKMEFRLLTRICCRKNHRHLKCCMETREECEEVLTGPAVEGGGFRTCGGCIMVIDVMVIEEKWTRTRVTLVDNHKRINFLPMLYIYTISITHKRTLYNRHSRHRIPSL